MKKQQWSAWIFKREAPGICPVCPMVNPALSVAKTQNKIGIFFAMCNFSDFIAMSETNFKLNCRSNVKIPNYNFVHAVALTNAGGVGLYQWSSTGAKSPTRGDFCRIEHT